MANNKNTSIKSLLLRAWRERWSDIQWSINIKKALPPGGNGDSCNLAELILQQALVGASPNYLVLSYLKHALSSQVVSYCSVIRSIVQTEDLSKPYCIKSLMEIVEGFVHRVSCFGNYEDSLTLAKCLVSLVRWSLQCILGSVQKLSDDKQATEYSQVIKKASGIVLTLVENPSSHSLMYIAVLEDNEVFPELSETVSTIQSALVQTQSSNIPSIVRDKLDVCLNLIPRIQQVDLEVERGQEVMHQPLNFSINVLLAQEAVLNPTTEIEPLMDQLMIIEKMQKLTRPVLICELLRSCMMGLIDSTGGHDELKWAAFTFLKLPQLFNMLHKPSENEKTDLELGLDLLLTYVPLLDLTDVKCNCDCLHFLLEGLCGKYSIITETQREHFMSQRKSVRPLETQSSTQPSPSLILRADTTVSSILKTLDADYSKKQEALLGVLCHMMSGKSFELILAAAAATGKLQSFAVKLIKFNEFAKQTTGEGGKAAQTRALLFDISFLMLCHITQLYGTELLSSSTESSNSFFAQWALRCLPENGKYRSPDMWTTPEPNKVEVLLGQLNPGAEIKTTLTRWHELCGNIPFAIQEILTAWEYETINADIVKTILDSVKSRLCCLPVVVSAWLCSFINTLPHAARAKPIILLQQLNTPIVPNETNQYYNERSNLMSIVLKKMVQDILPPGSPKILQAFPTLQSCDLALDLLVKTFHDVFKKCSIDQKSVYLFDHLLSVGGTEWFCQHLVEELLSFNRPEDVGRALWLTYGLIHMDIEMLTLALIQHVIPNLLRAHHPKDNILIDPKGRTLTKLCIMCIMATQTARKNQKGPFKRGRKRSRRNVDVEEQEDADIVKPSKIPRVSSSADELSLETEVFSLDFLSPSKEAESSPAYNTKDPLNRALVNLFRLFGSIVSHSDVSPRTGLVLSFMEEAIQAGSTQTQFLAQFMPPNMIAHLIKILPRPYSTKFLLAWSDLTSTTGRRMASKVICQNACLQCQQTSAGTQTCSAVN